MAVQYSVAVRNAQLDAIEATIGPSAVLRIRSGAAPSSCLDVDSGTVLATISLPADWMNAASNGLKTLSGVWQDESADGTGVAGHFRIYNSAGTVCGMQGTVSDNNGSGDLKLDTASISTGQSVTISSFTINASNA